jgi:tetratricopeptide (TPR) repeat protein
MATQGGTNLSSGNIGGDAIKVNVDNKSNGNLIGKDLFKDNAINVYQNKIIFIGGATEINEVLKEFISAPSAFSGAGESKISLAKLELTQKKGSEIIQKVNTINDKFKTKIDTIQTSELKVSLNELSVKELILKGNGSYSKGFYQDAERWYRQALELDQNNVFCMMNLNFLYAENLYKFDECVKIMYKLVEIEPGLETKSNLVESLLKVGNYEEARKYALEVINTPEEEHVVFKRDSPLLNLYTLDYTGYQTLNRFFVLCSYLLEVDVTNGNKELVNFLSFYKQLKEDFKIEEKQWSFKGLINAIYDVKVNYLMKFVLYNIIDLLEGKIGKLTKNTIYAIQCL